MLAKTARAVMHREVLPRMEDERATHARYELLADAATYLAVAATLALAMALVCLIGAAPSAAMVLGALGAGAGLLGAGIAVLTTQMRARHVCFDPQAFYDMRMKMLS